MHLFDLAIVLTTLLGLIALAGHLARRQVDTTDYYLGAQRLPAWALGLSLAANQVSAISLVGAPAFVAVRQGGGLVWLQYELAVPLAMAALVIWGVPFLRRARGAEIYSAVEDRLGTGARRFLATLFLLGRGLGAGVVLYSSSLVVDACSDWGLSTSLVVVAGVAIAYTGLGGLVADVFTDVLQLALLWGGTLVASVFLAWRLISQGKLLEGIDNSRMAALDLVGHGLGDGATFAFWPMLIGGFFLYLSYYGCDQTQAQRILAADSDRAAQRALTIAALVRFPLVLTYCIFGLLLGSLLAAEPGFAQQLTGRPADALVPQFIVNYLPMGLLGLAVAGILAALKLKENRASLLWARGGTVVWGILATAFAWWFSQGQETVIEMVNRAGSLVYGPILAIFLLAWTSARATGRSAVLGGLIGVGLNLLLSIFAPSVSWLWWNPIGCLTTLLIGHGIGSRQTLADLPGTTPAPDPPTRRMVYLLLALFGLILTLLVATLLL